MTTQCVIQTQDELSNLCADFWVTLRHFPAGFGCRRVRTGEGCVAGVQAAAQAAAFWNRWLRRLQNAHLFVRSQWLELASDAANGLSNLLLTGRFPGESLRACDGCLVTVTPNPLLAALVTDRKFPVSSRTTAHREPWSIARSHSSTMASRRSSPQARTRRNIRRRSLRRTG